MYDKVFFFFFTLDFKTKKTVINKYEALIGHKFKKKKTDSESHGVFTRQNYKIFITFCSVLWNSMYAHDRTTRFGRTSTPQRHNTI